MLLSEGHEGPLKLTCNAVDMRFAQNLGQRLTSVCCGQGVGMDAVAGDSAAAGGARGAGEAGMQGRGRRI